MSDGAPLDVRKKDDGATFRVKVRPSAPRAKIVGLKAGVLRVDVDAPPDKGAANDALARFVARLLKTRASAVSLLSGASSREKTLFVSGITPDELAARLLDAAP